MIRYAILKEHKDCNSLCKPVDDVLFHIKYTFLEIFALDYPSTNHELN